jgi:epoxyqueuosine reductase
LTSAELTGRIKAAARALGFDPVGITTAEPVDSEWERLQDFLARGEHGSMAYLAKEPYRRIDPKQLVPDARSVVVLGMSYAPEREVPESEAARVARYARGRDYHKVIFKQLRALEAALADLSGRPFRGRTFVDTGPLLERAFARRAGLGFIGKNTMLIHPRTGSYFFLSVLLTDLELVADPPATGDCGSCRLCIEACPTGALDVPYQLKATRCISYLTIEERGHIPVELRPSVGEWAFGCDTCQEVCPYNRRSPATDQPAFAPDRGAGHHLNLDAVLALADREAFLARFAGTPLTRPKREGILRNACLAAAHARRTDLIPALERCQTDQEPVVREAASWALAQLRALKLPADEQPGEEPADRI